MENWSLQMKGQRFDVLKKIKNDVRDWCKENTHHIENDRQQRMDEIKSLGPLVIHSSYIINTNHICGLQIHTVYTNGVVIIGGLYDRKIITAYLLKPYQLNKYGITDQKLRKTICENNKKES